MTQPRKIIVFSDIHIATPPRPGPDAETRLREGLTHAVASVPDAELILLCGDLTHSGDAPSYRRLRALLDGLPLPVVPMLGNHDRREAFRAVFPEAVVDENGFVQQTRALGPYRLITLDTLVVARAGEAFTHAGELCEARLSWLDRQLTEAEGAPCILALHHPPHDTGFESMDAIKLRDGAAFYDLILRHGNVRHIIAGHIHRTISGAHRGIPFSIFKSPVGQMPLMFEGSDTSIECDDPPAFGIVMAGEHGITIHTEDFPSA